MNEAMHGPLPSREADLRDSEERDTRLAPGLSLLEALRPRECPLCRETSVNRTFAEGNLDVRRLDGFAFSSRKIPEFMHYRLMECLNCDLVYAGEMPGVEFLAKAYHEAEFSSGLEAEYASRTYAAIVSKLMARLPDRCGALDIGTGDGCFLERLLELGFTGVRGVEPSQAPIEAAKPEIRPLIHHGLFEAGSFEPESFRLITCFQTIEHVDNPLTLVRSVASLLQPDSAFVLVCHNRRGLLNRLLGSKSPIRDVEHLQLFSPRSAVRLMEMAGFREVTVTSIVNRYPLDYWLRLLPIPRSAKSAIMKSAVATGLGKLPVPFPVGNLAVTGFKP